MTDQNTSVLDVILEKASNIENESNQTKIIRILESAIMLNSKKEREVRTSTITVTMSDKTTRDVIENIADTYLEKTNELPCTIWQDKFNCHVQFPTTFIKNSFIRELKNENPRKNITTDILTNMQPENADGHNFTRKTVRLEIFTLSNKVDAEKTKNTLNKMCEEGGGIFEFKEGKRGPKAKGKNFYFRVNAVGFLCIFEYHEGILPYSTRENNRVYKTNLYIRINSKPYTCRDCFKVGQHTCPGKICNNCSKTGHSAKDCRQMTKYCDNCTMKGHRAKDTHCPHYLNEVAKELRKMDIPLDYLEEKELRIKLIKYLQIR